jgi:adenylate cyclase
VTVEVERKYLVRDDAWRADVLDSAETVQGYLAITEKGSVRVRLKGSSAYLTIKSRRVGDRRDEYEYPIDVADAREMFAGMCVSTVVKKVRHRVPLAELVVEIDELEGANNGLVLTEIELTTGKQRPQVLLASLGEDVTHDDRYYSSQLSSTPFSTW